MMDWQSLSCITVATFALFLVALLYCFLQSMVSKWLHSKVGHTTGFFLCIRKWNMHSQCSVDTETFSISLASIQIPILHRVAVPALHQAYLAHNSNDTCTRIYPTRTNLNKAVYSLNTTPNHPEPSHDHLHIRFGSRACLVRQLTKPDSLHKYLNGLIDSESYFAYLGGLMLSGFKDQSQICSSQYIDRYTTYFIFPRANRDPTELRPKADASHTKAPQPCRGGRND
jgi:hypothetical protein